MTCRVAPLNARAKNYFSYTMKKLTHPNTLTSLNIITGIALLAAGIIYYYKTKSIDMSISWLIFGAMYLVMQSYACDCKQPKRVIIFAWAGAILSTALVVFYILN